MNTGNILPFEKIHIMLDESAPQLAASMTFIDIYMQHSGILRGETWNMKFPL